MANLSKWTLDLRPLRESRDFRLMWMGATVSSIGTTFSRMTVPYLVYKETESYFALGVIAGVTLVPMLICAIAGGAVADAFDRRKVSMISATIGGAASLLHALNVWDGRPWLWAVYALHAVSTSLLMGGAPASRSALPFLVDREMLPSALMLQSTTYTFSAVVGPALAGLVITTMGARAAFLIDAATFAVGFACWYLIRPIPPVRAGQRVNAAMVFEGFRALRGHRPIIGSFLADINAMVFGMPQVLFVAVAAQRFPDHKGAYGLLSASIPAGMVIATIFSGWTKTVTRHGYVVILSIVVWGIAITGFGFTNGLFLSMMCLAIAGAADMISGVSRNAMLQLTASPELQGRMQGVGMAVWTAGPALGDFEAGGLAALTSLDASIWIGGVACVFGIGVIAALLPEFTLFDAANIASDHEVKPNDAPTSAPAPT